ncbi:hypothetical protein RHS03_07810, partial [Rhizoctonia solani]
MGHCVHNQESRLTKGHLQEDALNSNALDLMLGIAANHLPEACWPPGLARDPPYKEEVPQPSTDKERKQEENKRIPNPAPTTLLDPVERGPANHPRRPATEPTQEGTIGWQVNKLARKQTCEEDSPAGHRQGVGHHGRHVLYCALSTKDRRQTQDWGCKLPPGADQEGVSHAPDARVNREGNQQPHTGDQGALGNGQGEQGNFETLRTVKAPKSSIGEDKDKPSPGSNAGAKLAIVGNQDNPDVHNATDHIAKWTNVITHIWR